jgi:hypothetical protein
MNPHNLWNQWNLRTSFMGSRINPDRAGLDDEAGRFLREDRGIAREDRMLLREAGEIAREDRMFEREAGGFVRDAGRFAREAKMFEREAPSFVREAGSLFIEPGAIRFLHNFVFKSGNIVF